ncbi:cupin domain-containing protein [Parasegetibacter sp. NRK P23]|uniref:cupin domain-containing protein n=1 Tax=Parasegetibacter sp. NRK P23 TaxID=2942999 RepID=UPI00204444BF|nr:cupin domain-containing protein [Parasegetibacter sp. NRK P23]MCM5530277.1 cupin domain-containing protein [Parasegetibacter sp. NRK P23]
MNNAEQLVARFNLLPHPEGGFYAETYKSGEYIRQEHLPERFSGARSFSTAIYFLLPRGNFSAFHRIKSDECWHFYAGETLLVHVIHSNGTLETIRLGNNMNAGETFQYVVPAGCWFASEPAPQTNFSFVGCTVAPGFDFADFELAKATELTSFFPEHHALITRLCRM